MKSLQDIAKIDPKAHELLEAAGYIDVAALKGLSLNEITDEVIKANHALEILEIDPTPTVVKQWLDPIKGEISDLVDLDDSGVEASKVTSKDLLAASFAIPLSAPFIEKNEINVDDLIGGNVRMLCDDFTIGTSDYEVEKKEIPSEPLKVEVDEIELEPAHVIQNINEDITVKAETVEEVRSSINTEIPLDELDGLLPMPVRPRQKSEEASDINTLFDNVSELDGGKVHIDKGDARINKSNILTMDVFREKGSRIEPLKNTASGDLTRSTRRETNAGVDPSSKRFIRGVLHKRAGSFMFSLFAYLTFILCVIAGFSLPLLALIDKEKYGWAMFAPVLVIIGILIYFMFTGRASCPICNQKQFAPKNCLKHRDAHRFPIIGYMLPTALHVIFFKWFKCIFCGTSVRLKE